MTHPICTRLIGPPLSRHRCNEPASHLQRFGTESRALCPDCAVVVLGQAREHGMAKEIVALEGVA